MIAMNGSNTLFVYRKNTNTASWVLETSISAGSGYIYPGISGDGNTIIVSNGSSGSKKYTYSAGTWSAAVTLTGTAVFGLFILVNNDASRIFFFNTSNPPLKIYNSSDSTIVSTVGVAGSTYMSPEHYGNYSAAISDDGNIVVMSNKNGYNGSTFYSTNTGVIVVATFISGSWSVSYTEGIAPEIGINKYWGTNACISGNGSVIAVSRGWNQSAGEEYTYPAQDNLDGTYFTGYQEISIYSNSNGTITRQTKIPRTSNQFSNSWGNKLAMNTTGDTLVVGCWNNNYNTTSTFVKRTSQIIGSMMYAYVYKNIGGAWTLFSTYMTDLYRNNLMYNSSRYGAHISIDSSGNSLVISEDNYYLKPNSTTCNSVGRIHLYNVNNAKSLDVTGGLRVKDNIYSKRDIIADGSCLSNKVYTGMCSVLDTLTIGGSALYGLNDGNSIYDTQSYSLLVKTPNSGAASNGAGGYNAQGSSRVRFDGPLYIYGGYFPAGSYTAEGLLITLDDTNGIITANDMNLSRTLNVAGSLTAGGGLYSQNLYANNAYINGGNVTGQLNLANAINRDTTVPILSKRINGPLANKWDLGSAFCNPVTMSSDGNVILTSTSTNNTLQIYRRDLNTLQWGSPTTIVKNTAFLSLSGDGNVIACSNGTTIFIYRWSGSAWTLQTQTITNSTYGGNFVKSEIHLSYDGSKILVSSYNSDTVLSLNIYNTVTGTVLVSINLAGNGYVVTGGYSGTYYSGRELTFKTRFSADGTTIITSNSNGTGRVLIYDINYTSSTATLNTTFTGSTTSDLYGKRIAMNSIGTVIAFSAGSYTSYNNATSKARVLVYKRSSVGGSDWTLDKTFYDTDVTGLSTPGFGSNVYLDDTGNTIFISTNNENGANYFRTAATPGIVSISKYVSNSWSPFTYITESLPYNTYGDTLAINSNGTVIAINAFRDMSIASGSNTLDTAPYGGSIFIYDAYSDKSMELKSSNSIVLSTGTTPIGRVTIDSTGYIGIGTAPVNGTTLTISGSVTATGSITGASDDRLKDNEQLITDATETIMKLRPEIYDKKPTFESDDTTQWQKESGLIAQQVWYGAPELRHLIKPGQYISGTKPEIIPLPSSQIIRYIDSSGNEVEDPSGNIIVKETIPNSETVNVPVYSQIDPAKIVDIPLPSDANIQQDPDYKALGWGDTPASLNYIGLIPYLIKSIQELKTEINAQHIEIEQQKTYIQTLETRFNK